MPKVEKEDIPATKLFPKVSGDKDKKYYKVGTNGIIYHDYIFPIKNLNDQELSLASLYAYLLTNVGLKRKSYEEIQEYQSLITGSINASIKSEFNDIKEKPVFPWYFQQNLSKKMHLK